MGVHLTCVVPIDRESTIHLSTNLVGKVLGLWCHMCQCHKHYVCVLHPCPRLQSAINISSIPLLTYLPDYWEAAGMDKDAWDQEQLKNATCGCSNGTASLVGTPGYDAATYLTTNCSGECDRAGWRWWCLSVVLLAVAQQSRCKCSQRLLTIPSYQLHSREGGGGKGWTRGWRWRGGAPELA
jgi:hypothetical protein